jgi:hypothetical protein
MTGKVIGSIIALVLAARGARAAAGAAGRRPCQPPAAELAKPFHCMFPHTRASRVA